MAWAPDYATVDELAATVRISDNLDDVQLALAISAASRAIDHATGRQFGKVDAPQARVYTACDWAVAIDDLMDTSNVVVASDGRADRTWSDTVNNSYVSYRPGNAGFKGRPYTKLAILPTNPVPIAYQNEGIKITASWGWTSVPAEIKQATLLQASRVLARRDAPFGVAGSPEAGSEVRLLARLDPDVAVIVAPFRRWWGAV